MPRQPPAKALTVLKRARALIVRPDGWVKGSYQKNRRDYGLTSGPKYAYCAIGSVQKAGGGVPGMGSYESVPVMDAKGLLSRALPKRVREDGVINYNDGSRRKKADIVRLFDRAIALAKKEGN